MEKIKVGIVGAGMMGLQHSEAIRRVPGTEIVALANNIVSAGKDFCEKLAIPAFYEDYKEMIRVEKPDAIHICTPNHTHFEIASYAIRHHIHVFCEKPLGNSSQETQFLCQLAEKHQVIAAVNFNYRQNVMVKELRSRLMDSSFGKLFLIRGSYLQDWMQYDSDYNWRCQKEMNGPSRTIADIGSHWFDCIHYLTGQKIKKVLARMITVYPQRKKYSQTAGTFGSQSGEEYQWVSVDTEDAAFILFEMEDGTPGTLTVSQVSGGHKNDMMISMDGSLESLEWHQETPDRLWINSREHGNTMIFAASGSLSPLADPYTTLPAGHAVGWADALRNSVASFYDGILGKTSNYVSFQDGHHVVKIIEACLRSHVSGQWEEVD